MCNLKLGINNCSGIYFLNIRLAWFKFIEYIAASWKVFKFQGGQRVCKWKFEMFIYVKMALASPETFSESSLQV